ncbi:D-tagatose-bisphosphate aldolase, class II, non-catalytic subunit [Pseudokordiimonas caeni]|uniref:D-tagatose-bisphosphate aldolase, class II, non-catalytic subunit n=1 Tax=Pseudokordiimonas caeni TaxID=2997908 RepID=UPI002810E875|nr:D-tagatose-bisphosphate aldolase, class II, non-catalytic subunit [Pseudokordiimonas caeni]
MQVMQDIVSAHKKGAPVGIYSVCSAHPLVIEASLRHGEATDSMVLIEATSNQVNQDGGYTGMRPADFVARVHAIADQVGFKRADILFGGDHLGPNCWQHLAADEAMAKSDVMIDQYVRAGFRKIHLDCSMSCADDPVPLTDAIVASRAVRLCAVAEAAWKDVGGEPPVYIIGTEVPVPGGATEDLETLAVTSPEAAEATILEHQRAFEAAGLGAVWPRVIGLVVQPGVEFDHHKVVDYVPEAATSLSRFIERYPTMVFEAHSTDYQTPSALKALVRDHFAILKVGPGLTYALREAILALDTIERELLGDNGASHVRRTVQQAMQDNPVHWRKYYAESGLQQRLDLEYSYSDRIRYYWAQPQVEEAVSRLIANLKASPPPLTMLSQYMPEEYWAVREGRIRNSAEDLIIHRIEAVLKMYSGAAQVGETIES